MAASGALLTPYRAAGFVSDSTPAVVQRRGTETFVTTSVGRAFQVYNCANLRVRFVGPQLPGRITALEVHGDYTFAAVGADVHVVHRVDELGVLRGHAHPVRLLTRLGELLVSVCAGRQLNAWHVVGTAADFDAPAASVSLSPDMAPTAILHPATYLNKLLVGGRSGALELWNVRSGRRVYRFVGWGSAVRALAQATAVDVVAVGLESGRVLLHHLREDATLASFEMHSGAACALAFRTDGVPILASASDTGHVALWQLDERKLAAQIEFAHDSDVRAAHFLHGEPVLLTSGADNALRMWLFDQPSGGARLLRARSGHSAPPTRVRFYSDGVTGAAAGAAGATDLLSAGADRSLRRTSLWLQQQDSELSQGHVLAKARKLGRNTRPSALKLPSIVDFDAAALREREWANLVSCHAGSALVSTWHTSRRALGKLVLSSPAGERAGAATAVCASRCGNYAIVGTASGRIDKFNLQSGMHRGRFGGEAEAGDARAVDAAGHRGAVRGLAIDGSQRYLISAGHDGTVRLWELHSRAHVATLLAESAVARLCAATDSALVAAACDDARIRVFDVRARTLVRQLDGHTRAITDLAFTPDGRCLLSAGLDGSLRLVDIPTARLVAWHSVSRPVTSLAWSPRGEFLATTHAGCVAVCVWANRALFSNLALDAAVDRPTQLPLPAGALGDDDDEGAEEDGADGGADGAGREGRALGGAEERSLAAAAARAAEEAASRDALRRLARPAQLADALPTLSGVPAVQWRSLHALEQIQERNKPEKPPEAPPETPFFLATRAGLEPEFIPPPEPKRKRAAEGDEGGAEAEAEAEAEGADGAADAGRDGRGGKTSRVRAAFGGASGLEDSPLLRHIRRGTKQGSYGERSRVRIRRTAPRARVPHAEQVRGARPSRALR